MQLIAPPKRLRKGVRRQARSGRGVALILVLTTVAILAAVGVDLASNARVNLELAVQSRDALRARSLAMSAMNYSRLVLHFQRKIDGVSGAAAGGGMGQLMQLLQSTGGGGGLDGLLGMARQAGIDPSMIQSVMGGAIGGMGGAGGMPAIRLWQILPPGALDSNAIMGAFTAAVPAPDSEAARKSAAAYAEARPDADGQGEAVSESFGDFAGSFSAEITDEDQKINPQRLEYSLGGGPLATFVQLRSMIEDPKYDFLFTEEDANRDRIDRNDLLIAMKDFVDADEQQSQLDPTSITSPFLPGFGDENGPYQRYKRRYKAKNAKLDSLEELRMVVGVNDAFMAAFGSRLTVWPDVNSKLNINTNDPLQMLINIMTAARNPQDPMLRDPVRLQLIMQQIELIKRFPFIGLSVGTFTSVLEGNGIQVRPEIKTNTAQNVFLGDKSSTFRIVATGEAGRVKKKLTAVVRYDDGLGQLLYWHEE